MPIKSMLEKQKNKSRMFTKANLPHFAEDAADAAFDLCLNFIG